MSEPAVREEFEFEEEYVEPIVRQPFILCEGLVKIYQVAELEMVALQGLNFSVEKGELVGVVGASGSGKSTLMNILGGLDRPSAGKVLVGGNNLLRMPDRELNRYRRDEVGFVWQQSTRNLVPYLNAIQNVMLPMTLAGETGKEKHARAEALLDAVGLVRPFQPPPARAVRRRTAARGHRRRPRQPACAPAGRRAHG